MILFFIYILNSHMLLRRFLIDLSIFTIISVFSILIFYVAWWDSTSFFSDIMYMKIIWIIFATFFLVKLSLHILYDRPIATLEHTIKRFLMGSLKDEELQFKRVSNPHLNYVLLFFSKTLHTLKHIKSEFLHGKEIKWEVELASEIQDKLLKKKTPHIEDLEIIAKSKPAWEIGGDSFDVISQWENHYIYVGDATGHWVGAWFIMMMVNALISGFSKATQKWSHVLALTNDIIKPRVKANLLMSLLLVRWNEKEKKLYVTWAGHEYLIIYKYNEKKCHKIKSGGVALWMTKNIHKLLRENELVFEPNDVIILYSDGITEAINKPMRDGSEEMFWELSLINAIEDAPGIGEAQVKTARSIFKNISIRLSKFMGYKHIQLDDITLLTIQYKSPLYNPKEDCSEDMGEDFITEWNWD